MSEAGMGLLAQGALRKMEADAGDPVQYRLVVGDERIALNPLLGKPVRLVYKGLINCTHCGRKTNKSFNQGYCYPCFRALPQCDRCIMSPELCHIAAGTCRDAEWGETHCQQDHIVYLANSSGVKVGITRQVPTRWIDQGAVQALPIFRVATRMQSGLLEDVLREHISDRTNWRTMLKGQVATLDLKAERDRLLELCQPAISHLQAEYGLQAIQPLDASAHEFSYPVLNFPVKVSTHNLDKQPEVSGVLQGIKGQYLILDSGVINIRKFTAYQVEFFA